MHGPGRVWCQSCWVGGGWHGSVEQPPLTLARGKPAGRWECSRPRPNPVPTLGLKARSSFRSISPMSLWKERWCRRGGGGGGGDVRGNSSAIAGSGKPVTGMRPLPLLSRLPSLPAGETSNGDWCWHGMRCQVPYPVCPIMDVDFN